MVNKKYRFNNFLFKEITFYPLNSIELLHTKKFREKLLKDKFFSGKVLDNKLILEYNSYSNNLKELFPTLIVMGKQVKNDKTTGLQIVFDFPKSIKLLYFFANMSIITAYFIDKYSSLNIGKVSETNLPLLFIPFTYMFLLINFFIQVDSCKKKIKVLLKE